MADRRRQGAEDAGQHPLTAFLEIARRGRSCAKLLQLPELRAGQHGHKIVGTTEPQRDEILQRTSEKLLRVADPLIMIALYQVREQRLGDEGIIARALDLAEQNPEIGSASCRERVSKQVKITVVAESLKT